MRQQTNTSWRRSCSNQKYHGTNGTLYERGIAKYLNQFEESHLTSTHEYTTTFAPFGLPAYRPFLFGTRLAPAAAVGPTNPIVQLHPPPVNFNNPLQPLAKKIKRKRTMDKFLPDNTYKRGGDINIERGMKGSDNIWTSMFMMPKK